MLRNQRTIHRYRRGAVALIALGLVAAACGSDSKSSSGVTAAPATNAATTPATDAAAPATTTAGATETTAEASSGGKTVVRWFVGLGTGSQAEQIDREKALIDKYNSSQDKIKLEAEFVDNKVAKDALATEMAGGNPPDIIGPVGREGANAFSGQYLDLGPLITKSGIDLSQYEPEQIAARKNPDGTIDSLPFASYPAALFYNKDLFDEAGLPYPPHKYGEKYGVGTQWEGEWNIDKLEEIAKILTVDSAGKDATDPAFDKTKVAQWGYNHQFTEDPKAQGTLFGAGNIIGADNKAHVPPQWLAEWKWYHHMIFEVGASPTDDEIEVYGLSGNAFNSGKIAMAVTHLWYTCCLTDGKTPPAFKTFWDVAAVPSYNGVATAKLHADTFRIQKDSKNPDAAFEVLSWIQGDAALDFLTIYGAMPARIDIRKPYFEQADKNFTQKVDWQVFLDGLKHTDNPSHELDMPKFVESDARVKELDDRIRKEPDLDLDAASKQLEEDLNKIWASA